MLNGRRTLEEIRDSVNRKMAGHKLEQSDACYRIANENFADLEEYVYHLIFKDDKDPE